MLPTAEATECLISDFYIELRRIAGRLLRHERQDHTLQKTALVHETFIRLFEKNPEVALSAENFLGLAAHEMRRILVDYSRKHRSIKRGGQLMKVPFIDLDLPSLQDYEQLAVLDEALARLKGLDERACTVVELKYFAGFTCKEVADILGISPAAVEQDWQFARSWLYGALTQVQPVLMKLRNEQDVIVAHVVLTEKH